MNSAREQRFTDVFGATHQAVTRFVARRVPSSMVDDVVAEVFLTAWRRLDDVGDPPLPWLYVTARNVIANSVRGSKRADALAVRIAETALGVFGIEPDPADAAVVHLDLAHAWERLSAAEQEVLSLAYWEDLPAPEIGEVLGLTPVAVRARLSRARAHLRSLLTQPSSPSEGAAR